ncbi:unnamed protein product [Urochloa humidicola]
MEDRFAVTVATGALGPVLVKLTALLGDEHKLQEGTRQDIASIKSELGPVHDLLERLWGREALDAACKDWMMEARELSYDMDDGIDHFTALDLEPGDRGFIQRETAATPFKEFIQSVKGVSKRCPEMQKIADANMCNHDKLTTDPRALFLHKDASELVGMGEKKDDLVRLLQEHEMVCIVGFAGMGKTTLADLVYHTIEAEFQCRAFVSVHLSPNMMEILGEILSQVSNGTTSARSGIKAAAEQNIINEISLFLSNKRYLVIIDDIWHWEEWEVIRKAVPKNNLGSKLLMTTRMNNMAERFQTDQGAHVYTPSFGYREAETLSDMILMKSVEENIVGLKRLSANIVDMCSLMPLAIICFSSAWTESHVQDDYGEWDTWVRHMLDDGFLSTPSLKPLVQSLCLGFDDLPVHLKTCLLYCTMYPPYCWIRRDCLVRKWIAEGFVSQEEVAEAYFDKLASRNLLQPVYEEENTYRVPPIMLALLVLKAKEDNFVARMQENVPCISSNGKKKRRLSLYTDRYPDEDVSHIRSLAVLGPQPHIDGVPFKKFKNLRVLEIDSCEGLENGHVVDMCGLIWLRYLGLKGAPITELPREIEGLKNLEILDVRWTCISRLPTEIGSLKRLETLDVSDTGVTEVPTEIEKLQCLKTLNISGTMVTVLPGEISELQHLEIFNASNTSVTELPTGIEKLQCLRTLNICGTEITELPWEITKIVGLQNLIVSNTTVNELPKEIRKLHNLRTLDVRSTKVRELPWEIPNSLSVLVGHIFSSNKVVKLPPDASPDWVSSSSGGASYRGDTSIMFFNPFDSRYEPLQVPMLRVAGRHMNVPLWVKQELSNVSSLDIRLYKLGEYDLEFLKQMPNLQALQLEFEVLPREPIDITGGGFSKLETFYVDCRLPRAVTFVEGAMPKLKQLEFKFYTSTARQDYSMGIAHLPSLEKIIFRCSEYYTSDSPGISATIEVVRKEAAEHPNQITLYVNGLKPEVFGSGARWISQVDKSIIEKALEKREQLRSAAEKRRDANRFVHKPANKSWISQNPLNDTSFEISRANPIPSFEQDEFQGRPSLYRLHSNVGPIRLAK